MKKFFIHETAIIGTPFRFLQGCIEAEEGLINGEIKLPEQIYIGPYSILGYNCKIDERVVIDAYCKIDAGAEIGHDTLITYRASIGAGAVVGDNCVIGGNIAEETTVGNNCRIFGKCVHKHIDSTISWDFHDTPEPGANIKDNSFIGHDAVIMGDIEIGPNSYICAGALITRTVPPYHIGYKFNQIIHYTEWEGELSKNPMFNRT